MDSFCKYFNRSKKKRKKGIKTSLFLEIFLIFKEKREDACTFPRFNFHPEDGRRKRVLGEGKLMYSVSGNTRKDPRRDCPKETKTPRSRGSREGVFVSLAKGMKNRESQPGFELTRTARAARFLTPPPPPSRCSFPPLSTLHQCQLTAYQGGWGSSRKNRDPCFNKVAFTSFGGDC